MDTVEQPILEHLGLGVPPAQFAATVEFYERLFGWRRLREAPGPIVFLGDGQGGRLELLARACTPLAAPHHVAFVVNPARFDTVVSSLREAGSAFEPPAPNAFGDRVLFFTDPAGNRCQLIARDEPLPR